MQIHALWCHPRSVSTAFERVMPERGDLTVLHEPFMYHHYLTASDRVFPDFAPDPQHPVTYQDIREMIRSTAEASPVFLKDMAYYVADALPRDEGFAAEMTHAFLVRDPLEAAVSYAKRDPAFTRIELGHEAQHDLFHALVAMGCAPLVVTADQLRRDPLTTMRRYWAHAGLNFVGHAFHWDDHVPEGWESVKDWHKEVLASGAIQTPSDADAAADLETLGEPFAGHAAHHMPFYEALRDIAHTQAHQK